MVTVAAAAVVARCCCQHRRKRFVAIFSLSLSASPSVHLPPAVLAFIRSIISHANRVRQTHSHVESAVGVELRLRTRPDRSTFLAGYHVV